ncbi:nuclear transport factor 2 family protein [Croceicoccus sp. F390]|uniref:Nuclear transport factor 2 family protein n=1 Tax=Croceicoccus esteveae TaxID=3075597 RepID=A0ABU2ZHB1_9SPHN|nr:nuclear transport factor 2 family protein [Croceicoccus sp. F390]MDT0575992.1 nuclear transport factor 2 family protein [Croceicoccus sp. F390]
MTGTSAQNNPAAKRLDALLSRAEIHDLCMAYCRGVDRADAELIRSVFTPDASVSLGITEGSVEQFASDVTGFVTNNAQSLFHAVANEWIAVDGDRGVGELYVIAIVIADGQEAVTGGRYLDRYERRDGRWLIARRVFVTDWTSNRPATNAAVAIGRTDGADPVHALWESLQ